MPNLRERIYLNLRYEIALYKARDMAIKKDGRRSEQMRGTGVEPANTFVTGS